MSGMQSRYTARQIAGNSYNFVITCAGWDFRYSWRFLHSKCTTLFVGDPFLLDITLFAFSTLKSMKFNEKWFVKDPCKLFVYSHFLFFTGVSCPNGNFKFYSNRFMIFMSSEIDWRHSSISFFFLCFYFYIRSQSKIEGSVQTELELLLTLSEAIQMIILWENKWKWNVNSHAHADFSKKKIPSTLSNSISVVKGS